MHIPPSCFALGFGDLNDGVGDDVAGEKDAGFLEALADGGETIDWTVDVTKWGFWSWDRTILDRGEIAAGEDVRGRK